MQQNPQPVRVDQKYNEMIKQMMTDRLWSYNKAINFIVRSYFEESDKQKPKKEVAAKKTKAPANRFVKPTWEEVANYFHEKGSMTCQDDAYAFIDHYTANGWKIGKNQTPMKCWKSAVNTWMRGRKQNDKQSNGKRSNQGIEAGHAAISSDDF